ncbi:HTH-type transcriptional regulator VirS [compost metagenome]
MTPRFNSPFDAWMFNTRLLSVPLIDADQALHRLIQQHLDALNGMEGNELPDYVQRLLRNLLPCGRATVEYIANVIKLSPRSLQRHLAQAGTSFQQILDQTRQAMTVRYLKESDLTLIQIAGILGYSDQSAFTRAFQRWYGVSPREWIKQHNFRPQNRFLKR